MDHRFDILFALGTIAGAAFFGYQLGKDHEQGQCADALLGLGLLDVAGQVQDLQYQPSYAELPVSWGSPIPSGCGCG